MLIHSSRCVLKGVSALPPGPKLYLRVSRCRGAPRFPRRRRRGQLGGPGSILVSITECMSLLPQATGCVFRHYCSSTAAKKVGSELRASGAAGETREADKAGTKRTIDAPAEAEASGSKLDPRVFLKRPERRSFKSLLAKYGALVMCIHMPISALNFISMYTIVSMGLPIEDLLGDSVARYVNVGNDVSVGSIAVAFAMHKCTSVPRYALTGLLTPIAARQAWVQRMFRLGTANQ